MNRVLTRAATLAGSLALGGGLVLAVLPGAAAADGISHNAFAAAASGPVTAGPVDLQDATGLRTDPSANILGLPLFTGLALDSAGPVETYSRVYNVLAILGSWTETTGSPSVTTTYTLTLVASQLAASCNSDTETESSNIIGGAVYLTTQAGAAPPSTTFLWNLPQHPAVDQTFTYSTATKTATLILNHHTGGFLTLNAVDSFIPSSPTQRLTLAHASCASEEP